MKEDDREKQNAARRFQMKATCKQTKLGRRSCQKKMTYKEKNPRPKRLHWKTTLQQIKFGKKVPDTNDTSTPKRGKKDSMGKRQYNNNKTS